ncbi:MAG TPA: hypothetical protein VLT36_04915, partial [Candidatus Dormibacteraeota bacterium]|nr:hypothetical protein [Candidatus Dormibacteraeota bacterium]
EVKSPGLFSDIFGLGKSEAEQATPEDIEKERLHKEQLRQLFGLPASPNQGFAPPNSFSGLVNQFGSPSSPTPSVQNPLDSISGVPHQSDSTLGVLVMPTLPQLATLPDPARALSQPGLSPVLPKQEPPRVMVPTPNFSAPRRQF